MHYIAAKFVPRVLTKDEKVKRVSISRELLERANVDENFLKTVVRGEEIKVQLSQWVGQSSPRLKLARMSQYNLKVTFAIEERGQVVIHHEHTSHKVL